MSSGAKQGGLFTHNRFHLVVVIAIASTSIGALAEDLFTPPIEPAKRISAQTGYVVESHLEVVSGTNIFTWTALQG